MSYPTANHFNEDDVPAFDAKSLEKVVSHKHLPAPTSCPHCAGGGEVVFTRNSIKYSREYGDWPWCYICLDCYAHVGVHYGTAIPLGTLANQKTADARKAAHQAFDPLWKEGSLSRTKAYALLAESLEIDRSDCHISWFDVATCNRVVEIAEKINGKPKAPRLGDLFS